MNIKNYFNKDFIIPFITLITGIVLVSKSSIFHLIIG